MVLDEHDKQEKNAMPCLKKSYRFQEKRKVIKKERNVKPEKNSIFLKKGKTVISVENRKFSRSWMTKRTVPLNLSREI